MFLAGLLAMSLVRFDEPQMLPTGKFIQPIGEHVSVGSYPINMIKTKDGKFLVVSTIGFRQFLSVIRLSDGKVVDSLDFNKRQPATGNRKPGLYYGMAIDPNDGGVYVSTGAIDVVAKYKVSSEGKLEADGSITLAKEEGRKLPFHPAAISLNSTGSRLLTVNNQTGLDTDFAGSLSVFDVAQQKEIQRIKTAGFPFDGAVMTRGPWRDRKVYVTSERDGMVQTFNLETGKLIREIHTGSNPVAVKLSPDQSIAVVSNAGSDTLTVIRTDDDTVLGTILLRPAAMRGLVGAGPTGLEFSSDGRTIYTTLSDMNAVAVVNLDAMAIVGMIPTGWLPTSVVVDGDSMFVSSAKGVKAQNPNHKPVAMPGLESPDQYIQNLIDGTVTKLKIPTTKELAKLTQQVIQNNRITPGLETANHPTFKNPGIKHVIYVIKENRTYDNVLGDIPKGNGDPSQTMFPRKVTPNQHAIAERFVLLDNFHVCAEVSQDGWLWSTAGILTPYASRNTPYNYSGRGRSYDTEGSNNNVPVDLLDIEDVAKPASGYLWDHAIGNGLSFRNYGCFTQFGVPDDKRFTDPKFGAGKATKKALMNTTDGDFRSYDNNYPDSSAYPDNNFTWNGLVKSHGEKGYRSRFEAWKAEFDEYVKNGDLPKLSMIRFGNDHTQGTRVGKPTPQSMVADNDYALAQVVEAVSNSPYWKETAIFVLEDDAQNGYDHVDAHRSTAYVISPYVKRSSLDSRFYNTDSMLLTMCLVLGIAPLNQYVAVASPMDVFGDKPENLEPFTAIKPDLEILLQTNQPNAYRAKDSEEMLSATQEFSESDEDLNDVLWGAIMGANTPRPRVINPWRTWLAPKRSAR